MFSGKIEEEIKQLVTSYKDQESPTYNVERVEYFIHPSNVNVPFVKIHVKGMDGKRGYIDESIWYTVNSNGESNRLSLPMNRKLVFFSELKKIQYEG